MPHCEMDHSDEAKLLSRLQKPTPLQREDMSQAHSEGLHDDVPREFCPDCDRSRLRRPRVPIPDPHPLSGLFGVY